VAVGFSPLTLALYFFFPPLLALYLDQLMRHFAESENSHCELEAIVQDLCWVFKCLTFLGV